MFGGKVNGERYSPPQWTGTSWRSGVWGRAPAENGNDFDAFYVQKTLFTGRMPFLPHNQQCRNTEGKKSGGGAGVVIYLERGADLHMAQLMPLPLTVSCFSKIQIGFTFLVPAHLGSPGKRAIKRVCVFVSKQLPW